MTDPAAHRRRILDVIRLVIGPPLLMAIAATQGVRVTGIATVSLAHPQPAWTSAVGDVLAVLALGTVALWTASVVAGGRAPLSHFAIPVAAAQLPMAALALVVGRRILGGAVAGAAAGSGEDELLAHPEALLSGLAPTAIAALLLTILVVGVLFTAYRRVTRLDGTRLPVSFAGGVVGAEIVCRLWLWWAG